MVHGHGPQILKKEMPKHQCFWQSSEIAKELKPEGSKGNHHGVFADIQKHRMAGFGLRRLRFGDASFLICCHGAHRAFYHYALTQIFGARPARSKTGVSSISSGAAPDGVSSAACRKASVVASSPSTVSLAALPES